MSPPNTCHPIHDFKRLLLRFPQLGSLFLSTAAVVMWRILTVAIMVLGTSPAQAEERSYRIQFDHTVLETLPHSRRSFTQGLIVDGDEMIESSGLYGKSFLHRYPVVGNTDKHDHKNKAQYKALPRTIFAEGITLWNNKLYLLTWQNGQALVLNPRTFELQQRLEYEGEGWGLATFVHNEDGKDQAQLVMSNGSDQLTFRDVETFAALRTLAVTDQQRPVHQLNDLTVAQGLIWANVWHSTKIVAIDPYSGVVVGKIDLRDLAAEQPSAHPEDVLNGIAWDEQRQGFWITGKRWAKRYLIRVEALWIRDQDATTDIYRKPTKQKP